MIYVATNKESVEKVREIILKEFAKVSRELGQKELKEVKDQMIGNHQISLEDSEHMMLRLLMNEIDDKAEKVYDYEKKIRAVKLSDVKKLAKLKGYSFFALVPE